MDEVSHPPDADGDADPLPPAEEGEPPAPGGNVTKTEDQCVDTSVADRLAAVVQAQEIARVRVAQLRQDRRDFDEQARRNAGVLTAAQRAVDEAEERAKGVDEQNEHLEMRRGGLESDKRARREQLEAEQRKLAALQAGYVHSEEQFGKAQSRICALETEAARVGSELDAALQRVSDLEADTGGLHQELRTLQREKSELDDARRRLCDGVETLRQRAAQRRVQCDNLRENCEKIRQETMKYEAMCQREVRVKKEERELTRSRCAKIVELQGMLDGYKIRELVKAYTQHSPQDIEDVKAKSDAGYDTVRALVKQEKKKMGEPGPSPLPAERAEVSCRYAHNIVCCRY